MKRLAATTTESGGTTTTLPPDSVTTHVLFCKGSWKIGSQSKEDKLRNMFVEIASTSPNNDSAPITPHALLLALRDHSSSLNEYFGKKSTDDILTAFSALDVEGQGAVTLSQFMNGASHALSGRGREGYPRGVDLAKSYSSPGFISRWGYRSRAASDEPRNVVPVCIQCC